jgi:hypothetical protein
MILRPGVRGWAPTPSEEGRYAPTTTAPDEPDARRTASAPEGSTTPLPGAAGRGCHVGLIGYRQRRDALASAEAEGAIATARSVQA